MSNPARPVTGTPIDTAWGLAVADTVVRVYPNAASRDADLSSFTAADLLGQVVYQTDIGALLIYAGPVMKWKPPWNVAWGVISYTEATTTGTASNILTTPSVAIPDGRQWRVIASACGVAPSNSWVQCFGNLTYWNTNAGTQNPTTVGGVKTTGRTGTFLLNQSGAINLQGNLVPHFVTVEDLGPVPGVAPNLATVEVEREPEDDPIPELWTPALEVVGGDETDTG